MTLLWTLTGYFIIKALLLWPFYYKLGARPLQVGLASSLAIAPLITILYHETAFDFLYVYAALILMDIFLYNFLLQKLWWKAILASVLLNTLCIIYFFLGNG